MLARIASRLNDSSFVLPLQLFHILLHEPQLIVGRDVPLDPIRCDSDRQIRGLRLKLAFRSAELNGDLASCLLEQPLAFAFGGGPNPRLFSRDFLRAALPEQLELTRQGLELAIDFLELARCGGPQLRRVDELLPYLVAPVAEIAGDR